MQYTLRPATHDDYDFLYNLHATTIPTLFLHVLKANRGARRLYRRLDFEIVEEREKRYVMVA